MCTTLVLFLTDNERQVCGYGERVTLHERVEAFFAAAGEVGGGGVVGRVGEVGVAAGEE